MKAVDIQEAQMHLLRLIERAQDGEEIVIAKEGRPVARLVAIKRVGRRVGIGGLAPEVVVPDDFNTMFDDEIQALFHGGRKSAIHRKP